MDLTNQDIANSCVLQSYGRTILHTHGLCNWAIALQSGIFTRGNLEPALQLTYYAVVFNLKLHTLPFQLNHSTEMFKREVATNEGIRNVENHTHAHNLSNEEAEGSNATSTESGERRDSGSRDRGRERAKGL